MFFNPYILATKRALFFKNKRRVFEKRRRLFEKSA